MIQGHGQIGGGERVHESTAIKSIDMSGSKSCDFYFYVPTFTIHPFSSLHQPTLLLNHRHLILIRYSRHCRSCIQTKYILFRDYRTHMERETVHYHRVEWARSILYGLIIGWSQLYDPPILIIAPTNAIAQP